MILYEYGCDIREMPYMRLLKCKHVKLGIRNVILKPLLRIMEYDRDACSNIVIR